MPTTKKPTDLSSVIPMLPPPSKLVIRLSARIPSTSSMIAALRIVVPTLVFSFPSSRSVSTVIPTLVAARIHPTRSAFMSLSCSLSVPIPPINRPVTSVPRAIGTITPIVATIVAAKPLFLSSFVSVSSPLEKRIKTTPICENVLRTSISSLVGSMIPLKLIASI